MVTKRGRPPLGKVRPEDEALRTLHSGEPVDFRAARLILGERGWQLARLFDDPPRDEGMIAQWGLAHGNPSRRNPQPEDRWEERMAARAEERITELQLLARRLREQASQHLPAPSPGSDPLDHGDGQTVSYMPGVRLPSV